MAAPASGTVVVRVGGVDFRTTRETLEQCGHGYFAALFEHQTPDVEEFGNPPNIKSLPVLEVDRDPELFRHVLAWMRSHRLPFAVSANLAILEDLEPEADFYSLPNLTAAIRNALAPLRLSAQPLRPFSVTTGTIISRGVGDEMKNAVVLKPHESCLVSYITGATVLFGLPRKHHMVECVLHERAVDSDDEWRPLVTKPGYIMGARSAEQRIAENAYNSARVLLASFVYKHMSDREEDEMELCGQRDKQQANDGICAPQYSQRVQIILGPRGVHNPMNLPSNDGTLSVDSDETSRGDDADSSSAGAALESKLVFESPDLLLGDNGAHWSVFGVIGPTDRVVEYASRLHSA